MIILILAAIIFVVSLWMANCNTSSRRMMGNEPYAQQFPLQSGMSQAQMQAALSNNTCSAAVNTLCSEAKGQDLVLPVKNLSGYLSDVKAACGGDFPAYGACAAQDPTFGLNTSMVLGGTHNDKFGFA